MHMLCTPSEADKLHSTLVMFCAAKGTSIHCNVRPRA